MKKDSKNEEKNNFFSKWARFFIDKYKLSIILLIALVVLGLFGASNNQRQDFPAIPINYVFISAVYPGASPEVVASDVINPIENELKGNDETVKIRSSASPSFGSIVVETKSFDKETINETISEFDDLAKSAGIPEEVEINVGTENAAGPSVVYVLSSEDVPYNEIIEKAPIVKQYLEKESNEIKEVQLAPESQFEVNILLDAEKLQEKGLEVKSIKQAIQANLQVLPGGNIKNEETNITKQITIENPVDNLGDIRDIVLAPNTKLSDVASIKRKAKSEDNLLMAGFIRDGEAKYSDQVVYLMAMKNDDGDVIRMKKELDEAINNIHNKNILDDRIDIDLTYDSSVYVSDQISSLLKNGFLGLVIILIVFMFFIDIRTGIVVSLIIPFAFLITLFLLYQFGISINILTTFAMILTLGILVDNAIVIAEGIQHRLIKYGDSKLKAAIGTIKDLGPAITAATATTVAVFVPTAMMGGIMGEFMKYIPYTIIIMLLTSYFLAISITPLLGKWILKEETDEERKKKKITKWQKYLVLPVIVFYGQRIIDRMVEIYGKYMQKVHKKWLIKILILVVCMIGFVASVSAVATGKVKSSQFPVTDTPQFSIATDFPSGTSSEIKREVMSDLMKEAVEVPYFEGSFMMQNQIFVLITDPAKRKDDQDTSVYTIVENLSEEINYIKEKAPEDTVINIDAQSYGPTSSTYDIIVELKNTNEEATKKGVNALHKFIKKKEKEGEYDVNRINNELEENKVSSVDIKFNEEKLREYGIAPLTSSMIINSVFSESDLGKITVREDGVQDEVNLLFNEDSRNSIEKLKELIIGVNGPQSVKLSDVADIRGIEKAQSISFIDGVRAVSYQIDLNIPDEEKAGRVAVIQKDIQNYLNEDKLNEIGLEQEDIAFGGFASDIQSDFNKLFVVFIIAMIAVYLILAYQFNSYLQPLMIMMAVPIALIGVFPGLWIAGSSIDMISGLGVITLVGIVVNDAIVFIDYFNRQRKKNKKQSLRDALVETGMVRFKPIFSTSVTTIAAILPLTIQDPFWRGLGTAVIAGLIFATFGNLVVLPIVICMFEKVFAWFRKKFRNESVISNK